MSLPTSIASYRDCEELFETATRGDKGARAKLPTEAECINLRSRLHYYRKLLRRESTSIYPEGTPGHNTCAYDDFVIQIIPSAPGDDGCWIYIQRRTSKILVIETLDAEDTLIDVESEEVKFLADQTGNLGQD